MTEEIIIDVSNCPHKSDDDCMEVPICNEYGDLMGYQSCEAQTLCPYRSQKKIERLDQENKELKKQIESQKGLITVGGKQQYEYLQRIDELEQENKDLKEKIKKYSTINEQDTKDYARLFNESMELRAENIELQRENEILKKKLDIAVGRSATHGEAAEKYWAALEEIQKAIKSYDLAVDNGASVDTIYTIRKIINEVLNLS